jgi:hypothetical protein
MLESQKVDRRSKRRDSRLLDMLGDGSCSWIGCARNNLRPLGAQRIVYIKLRTNAHGDGLGPTRKMGPSFQRFPETLGK